MAVAQLAQHGGDVNRQLPDLNPHTPLTAAIASNNPLVVHLLLKAGADTNHPNGLGLPPLHCAVGGRTMEILSALIDADADVHRQAANGLRVVHAAAAEGTLEVLELLLQRRASPNETDHKGATPLHYAVQVCAGGGGGWHKASVSDCVCGGGGGLASDGRKWVTTGSKWVQLICLSIPSGL